MAQDAARTNDQVVYLRSDGINIRRAYENPKWVVFLRYPPRACSRLGQMNFAAPAGHDDLIGVTACANKAQTLPEGECRG
jgi:hypothetical protein